MLQKVLSILCISFITLSFSQGLFDNNTPNKDWQVGIGLDIVRFADDDTEYIGEKTTTQLPRINVTKNFTTDFSIDASVSISGFDSVFGAENNFSYFSFDISGRYKYFKKVKALDPYVFVGLSLVNIKEINSPTINIGTGLTYWIYKNIGINGQIYYKNALDKQQMVSHTQISTSLIFGFDFNKKTNLSRCSFDR